MKRTQLKPIQKEALPQVLATAKARAQQVNSGEVKTVSYSSVMEKARAMIR